MKYHSYYNFGAPKVWSGLMEYNKYCKVNINYPPYGPPHRETKEGFFGVKETKESISLRKAYKKYIKEYNETIKWSSEKFNIFDNWTEGVL